MKPSTAATEAEQKGLLTFEPTPPLRKSIADAYTLTMRPHK